MSKFGQYRTPRLERGVAAGESCRNTSANDELERSARLFEALKVKRRTASALLRHLGRAGRILPCEVRGRGRIASALTSLLLKSGAEPIVHCEMAAGHRLRLDCRVPSHCWTFLAASIKYDDEKRSALLSFLWPSGVALDVGANIGFYTVPMAIRAKEIGSRVVAVEPVGSNAQWLRHNLALNGGLDVTQVVEVALGNEYGQVEIVLADDFIAGAVVGRRAHRRAARA
jgi:hypothetical protein